MTDREFKHLKRSELIDIIYEYQKQEEDLREEIRQLKSKLEDQNVKTIQDARAIADVVKNLSVFVDSTQKMADDYLKEIQKKDEFLKRAIAAKAKEKGSAVAVKQV